MYEDKIQKIREAALLLFAEKGYKETKITDIAETSEVSVGTIYSCFKGKKELFDSLNQPELRDLRPQYDARKKEIVWKALDIFGRNGYSATSMDTIASECGFTKAVLYQYFKSKEDLFSSIFYEPSITQNLDHMQIDSEKSNLDEVLYRMGSLFMKMFEDPARLNLTRIVIAESVRFPELGQIMYHNAINVVADKFSGYLSKFSAKKQLQYPDTKLAARAYFGMLYSFIITERIINPESSEYTSEEIVQFAKSVFQHGLFLR